MHYEYRKKVIIEGRAFDIKAHSAEELGRKLERKEQEVKHGLTLSGGSTLVNIWFKKYFRVYVEESGDLSPDTLRDRKGMYQNHISPQIGTMKIRDVTAEHCQRILNDLQGLSKDRIDKCYRLLYNMFKKAVKDKLIYTNPAEDLIKPAAENGEGRPITMLERVTLLDVGSKHKAGLWVKTMLWCGFRPGETDRFLGGHINYKEGLIYIDGTKSKAAKRIVPAPEELLLELRALNRAPDEYIFQNCYGDKMRKSSRKKLWDSLVREMNIAMGCRVYRNQVQEPYRVAEDLIPYCLRHTFATDLKDAQVPYSIRQELLGHANQSVTDKYTHRTENSLRTADKLLKQFRQEQEQELDALRKKIRKEGYESKKIPVEDLTRKFFPNLPAF